ncbi:hypothetical protein GDO81_017922 [Engystomops pustulosus]|uniref:Calmodulin-regulated spectrin-associated protein 2 n=1 Tax=Engystomops pustulosus TaxID=76066 RepID=A0AAV7A9H6_ENGPU|nr:hypothetical protein GDO81_017922 [Engystomops pustulosus]
MVDLAESAQDGKKTFIVPAIKPFDHYDFNRAKVASNLAWLVAKAFGAENIPEELQEPFYTDQYDQEHMKPPVVNLLLSADLYCRAGSLILKSDTAKPLLGHDAVIQALAQRGLYVTDHEKLVTERDLRKKPIQMSAHLAMIDTLMMAYTVEMVSIEKVIACVHKYSPFFQTADLPYDIEDAVMYWINKVNRHLKGILEQEQRVKEQQNVDPNTTQKARYRKDQNLYKQLPCIPLMENILKDGTDGCALATLIHFYCPEVIRLEDICFKESMSLADSLYNLQLIQEFCQEYLNGCCHFSLEDMLYASSSIKANYLVFMAELFWWFEVVKPSFVQPRVVDTQGPTKSSSKSSRFNRRHTLGSSSNPRTPQDEPTSPGPAVIRRSSSMSYVDGQVGTWPKEKRSSIHGVSFDISFDKEDGIRVTTPSRPIRRSVSTEGFSLNLTRVPKHIRKNLSFQPINGQGQSDSINEEWTHVPQNYDDLSPTSNKWDSDDGDLNRQSNGPHENRIAADELDAQIEAPSIEEALEIIHNPEKTTPIISDQINNGFFLHNADMNIGVLPLCLTETNLDVLDKKGSQSPVTDNTEVDTGIHVQSEDIPETMDEDSSLKDYTVSLDSDLEDHLKLQQDYGIHINNVRESVSPCPSSVSGKSQAGSTASSSSGIKMTSFAEQKFRKLNHGDGRSSGSSSQKTTPEGSELNIPQVVALGQIQEVNSLPQSKDTTQLLASEVVQLRMKLEEKRRAIEAQKKKVEAAFTRQRQKMGRTAFLTVVKKKGDGISPLQEEAASLENEKAHQEASAERGLRPLATGIPSLKINRDQISSRWLKSPTTPVDTEKSWSLTSPSEENLTEVDVGEYTKSIEKLNSSLNFLQQEMQRLALQQDMLMQMREKQAWVISPPQPSPQKLPQKEPKPATKPSVTWSPIPCFTLESPRQAHRSPQSSLKKTSSFPVKAQRIPRPNELKITPLNRTLTPPQSVDSLPRLRRFSPSQTQTRSFVYFGDDRKPVSQDEEAKDASIMGECLNSETPGNEGFDKVESYKSSHPTEKVVEVEKKPIESTVSEVLSQPIIETVCVTPNDEVFSQRSFATAKNGSLIEVPLSKLQPPESENNEAEAEKELIAEDQKVCCGFFFKDDRQEENDMAAKRAALLEKRLRRERENQQKKIEQETELEHKKEEARRKSEEERSKKEDEKARREFIKQEYLRRKQLKLMEDMDSVIKPRVTLNRAKKTRPKSIHRDHNVELPRTPTGAPPASSFSLASLNTGDNESVNSGKRTPSPFRSESVEGFLSPGRSGSRNGEKDWENASTTSSVASATEYTGPKLYKEPSAKSNKYIIQNAISHCCLAGKVNEGQKNKILEVSAKNEMEKSNANNFLILFRDSGCQFRSIYTYYPETEEITKLAGIGPRSISRKMIDGLYKYNSDRKQFSQIPAKTMSASVDAVTIHSHLWQAKRPMTPKKLLSSKA